MILQLSDILNRKDRAKEINFQFDFNKINQENDEVVGLEPVVVEGNVKNEDDYVIFQAKVNTTLQLTCSRCLEAFSYTVDLAVYEKFTNNKSKEDDFDVILIEGDSINIAEIIVDNIISALPIKRLCSKDCKGLCQQCGKNLNKDTCECDSGDIDIRLANLKDLFR